MVTEEALSDGTSSGRFARRPTERASLAARGRSRRNVACLALLACLVCGCGRFARRPAVIASETPTASELVTILNRNADRAESLLAKDLDISVHQKGQVTLPLDGQLALEKPRRFRLIATNPLSRATEADVGSNDHEFWFYIPNASQRRELVHCSYADYERVQASLPFHPEWVFQSIGLTPVSDDPHQQVRPGPRGTFELVTPTTTPNGRPASIVNVVDRSTGYLLERHLETGGRRTASSFLSRHRTDSAFGVVYPGTVKIVWPEAGLEISISLQDVLINTGLDNMTALWRMPREVLSSGAEDVDLGTLSPRRPNRPSGIRLDRDLRQVTTAEPKP